VNAEQMIQKLERIDDLPTLPVIAMELNRLLLNEDVSIARVKAVIEKDQAIVPRLLKLVNSAFFGLQSKVASLSHAIVILGFNAVRNAVLSISVIDLFKHKAGLDGFNADRFWLHSIAVAVTANHLAQASRCAAAENAFTAGLLHDIGKIVLYQHFPLLFAAVWARMSAEGIEFSEAEKTCVPYDHARIGGFLSKKWQLPPALADTIRCHHRFGQSVADDHLLKVVIAADSIAGALICPERGRCKLDAMPQEVRQAFLPQFQKAPEWMPQVRSAIDEACDHFLKEG